LQKPLTSQAVTLVAKHGVINMTTKQAIGYFAGHIAFIIVAITIIYGIEINSKINPKFIYIIYLGQGLISGYLGSKIEKEIKKFFE